MSFDRSLKLIFLGDAKSAVDASNKVAAATGPVDIANKQAAKSFEQLTTSMTNKFGVAGAEVQKRLNGIASEGLSTAGVVGGVLAAGAAVGAVALVKMAKDGVASFVSLAGEVRNYSRMSGAGAEESSRMVAASKALGIESSSTATAMFRLGVNVEKHADALKKDGIEVARNADGTVNLTQTLLNTAGAYQRTADQGEKNKLVMDAFGKSGAAIIPLLGAGADRLKLFWDAADRHHAILDDDDLQKARDYKFAMQQLGEAMSGLERELGSAVIPVLTNFAQSITSAVETGDRFTKTVGSHKGLLSTLASSLATATGATGLLGLAHKKAANDTDNLTAASEREAAAAVVAARSNDLDKAALDARSKAAAAMVTASEGIIGAHVAASQASRTWAGALDALAGKSDRAVSSGGAVENIAKKVADAQRAVRDATERAADAEDRIEDSHQKVRDAAQGVIDATQRLKDARIAEVDANRRVKESQDQVIEAMTNEMDAAHSLSDARTALDRVLRGEPANSTKATDAQAKLRDAEDDAKTSVLDLADAQDDLRDKQKALTDMQAEGGHSAQELQVAQRAVERAALAVERASLRQTDATKKATDAQTDLNRVLHGYPPDSDAAKKAVSDLESAFRSHEQALKAVTDAQRGVTEAQRSAVGAQQSVQAAMRDVTAANRAQEQSYKDVAKAEREARDAADDIVAKKQAVIDAHKATGGAAGGSAADHKTLAEKMDDAVGAADAAAKAFADESQAVATAGGHALTAEQRHDLYLKKLMELRDSLAPNSPLRQRLTDYINQLPGAAGIYNAVLNLEISAQLGQVQKDIQEYLASRGIQHIGDDPNNRFAHRASGGPVKAGVGYRWQEMGGDEFFVPNVDGTVVPGDVTRSSMARSRGGVVEKHYHLHVEGNGNAREDFKLMEFLSGR